MARCLLSACDVCSVWTILPLISCLCPCIGHLGIGDWSGRVVDFAGNYYVGVGHFAFGEPLKFLRLDIAAIADGDDADDTGDGDGGGSGGGNSKYNTEPYSLASHSQNMSDEEAERTSMHERVYNRAIAIGAELYRGRKHRLVTDNCHSHVAATLNAMGYAGRRNWTMVSVWWHFTVRCRYVSWAAVARVWLPGVLLWSVLVALVFLLRWLASK